MSRFVIVVDAQRDFMMPGGAPYLASAEALVAPTNVMLASLRPVETAGVLLTFDTHRPAGYSHSAGAAQFLLHCVRRQHRLVDGARRGCGPTCRATLHPQAWHVRDVGKNGRAEHYVLPSLFVAVLNYIAANLMGDMTMPVPC